MISASKILFMFFTLIICFGIPISLTLFICIKKKASIKAVLIGALIFFIFQIITRIPMLNVLGKTNWYRNLDIIWLSLFLGGTAGLFEEVGRFIGFKFMLKGKTEWENGVAYGIGHGGIEAILLTGMVYVNNLIFSFMINSSSFDKLIAPQLPSGQAEIVKSSLINTHSYLFGLAGLERLFAIIFHIAMSLVVLYGIKNRKKIYLLIAILIHTLLDTPVVIMSYYGLNPIIIELYAAVFAIVSLVFIIKSQKLFSASSQNA